MVRGCSEIIAGAFDGVGVTVPLGSRHAHRARRQQFVHRHAMPVDADAVPLSLGDLQQVHTHAGNADGLRRDGAFGRRGDLLQINQIDTHQEAGGHQKRDKNLHAEIVRSMGAGSNGRVQKRAEGNNSTLCADAHGCIC